MDKLQHKFVINDVSKTALQHIEDICNSAYENLRQISKSLDVEGVVTTGQAQGLSSIRTDISDQEALIAEYKDKTTEYINEEKNELQN